MGRFVAALVALAAVTLGSCARRVTVLSYNVCNLFDAVASGREYGGAASDAEAADLLRRKCDVIAGAIRGACPGGPDVVALQEIEGLEALRALRDGWLRDLGYLYYVAAGGPDTVTRVGFLSRLPIVSALSHLPAGPGAMGPQRAVLEVVCSIQGARLHLLNNHWKSKIGGVGPTEEARILASRHVALRVMHIVEADPGAEILVLGDFNESHDESITRAPVALGLPGTPGALGAPILLCGDLEELAGDGRALSLYEPWFEGSEQGSYYYAGTWSTPDHLLLSRGLLDGSGLRYRAGSFRAVQLPFLLAADGRPRGALERGDRVHPDHLPILVVLDVCPGGAPRPVRATAPGSAPPG